MDERLSVWGWETGTGTRFAVVVDVWGREGTGGERGVGEGDVRGVSVPFVVAIVRGREGQGVRGIEMGKRNRREEGYMLLADKVGGR